MSAFDNEIKKNLRSEGFGGDADAFKEVVQWSAGKFTNFRNQLRRRIITELKEGRDLKTLPIEGFARVLLSTYCGPSDDITNPERVKFALVLRSFLHKRKFLVQDSDEMECFSDFWGAFRSYFSEVLNSKDEEKWERLRNLDERRVRKYLEQNEAEA